MIKKDSGKIVWDMLKSQYKPLEKAFLKLVKDEPKTIKAYKKLSYMQKIILLDKIATKINL